MSERIMAHVELINNITPIEGADNIEVAHVLGWQVVVRKAENYSVGNKIVYVEIDSRCPSDAEWAQFLAPRNYKVKTIKLRGQISQGLILPMSILPAGTYTVGQDVAKVLGIEYDPNRTANIALIAYADGEKTYILAPAGLTDGMTVMNGAGAEVKVGNCLPLSEIPVGTEVHNIELYPGKGGQLVRAAGNSAQLMAKEGKYATLRLPSGEMRMVPIICRATIGTLGNGDHSLINLGKAGRKRHMGIRPTVRGSVMNPNDHPHGGGEGKTGIGRPGPVTPWGKPALGLKTRKNNKQSNKLIVRRRDGKNFK